MIFLYYDVSLFWLFGSCRYNLCICFELGAFYATRISALVTFGSIGVLGFFSTTVYGCCWSGSEFIVSNAHMSTSQYECIPETRAGTL